jgi:hypothetical protein
MLEYWLRSELANKTEGGARPPQLRDETGTLRPGAQAASQCPQRVA